MTDHEKILAMIENVSPDDTDTLDEIDARVWCFLREDQLDFKGKPDGKDGAGKEDTYPPRCWKVWRKKKDMCGIIEISTKYTRSRDALKSIRPEGWKHWAFFDGYQEGAKFRGEMFAPDQAYPEKIIQTDWLPTEELAELSAIIQAVAYDRQEQPNDARYKKNV